METSVVGGIIHRASQDYYFLVRNHEISKELFKACIRYKNQLLRYPLLNLELEPICRVKTPHKS